MESLSHSHDNLGSQIIWSVSKTGFYWVTREKRGNRLCEARIPAAALPASQLWIPGSTQEEEGPGFFPLQRAGTSVAPPQGAFLPVCWLAGDSLETPSHMAVSLLMRLSIFLHVLRSRALCIYLTELSTTFACFYDENRQKFSKLVQSFIQN